MMTSISSAQLRRVGRGTRHTVLFFSLSAATLGAQSTASADSAFTQSNWPTAARQYRVLANRDTADMRSRFRLGVALFEQRLFADAIPAFERTARAGFQPAASEFRLTRSHAQLGHADSAFAHLERALRSGVDLPMVTTHPDLAPLRGDVRYVGIVQRLEDAQFPCRRGVEAHQFDFWIGTWSVTPWADAATVAPVGQNVVTADLEHCVVLEAWTPRVGGNGKSINFWDTNRRAWRQVWIAADGGSLDYEGQFVDGAMRFSGWTLGATGQKVLQKLTFFPIAADTVRQLFEASEDNGATWRSTFDGRYVRVARIP